MVLGDLFDTSCPSPQLIAAAQDALPRDVIIMSGNHDIKSMQPRDHALGPLEPVARVVTAPVRIDLDDQATLLLVPYQPGPATSWLPGAIRTLSSGLDPKRPALLCLHLGMMSAQTPPFLRGAHDSIPVDLLAEMCHERGIGAVAAGNWHERSFWDIQDVQIQQIGALAPTGWDNPGFSDYGWAAVWDSETNKFNSVRVPGPRFFTLVGFNADRAIVAVDEVQKGASGCQLYLRWQVEPANLQAAKKLLAEFIADGLVVDGHVILDKTGDKEKARKAAEATSAASTFEEALAAFVSEMPLEEGVERQRVLELSKGYLK